jgi:hypothetical protein
VRAFEWILISAAPNKGGASSDRTRQRGIREAIPGSHHWWTEESLALQGLQIVMRCQGGNLKGKEGLEGNASYGLRPLRSSILFMGHLGDGHIFHVRFSRSHRIRLHTQTFIASPQDALVSLIALSSTSLLQTVSTWVMLVESEIMVRCTISDPASVVQVSAGDGGNQVGCQYFILPMRWSDRHRHGLGEEGRPTKSMLSWVGFGHQSHWKALVFVHFKPLLACDATRRQR